MSLSFYRFFFSQSQHSMKFYLLQRSNLSAQAHCATSISRAQNVLLICRTVYFLCLVSCLFLCKILLLGPNLLCRKVSSASSCPTYSFWEAIFILMSQVKFQYNKYLNSCLHVEIYCFLHLQPMPLLSFISASNSLDELLVQHKKLGIYYNEISVSDFYNKHLGSSTLTFSSLF